MKKGLYRLVGLHTIDSRNQLIWCCLGCKGQWKYERKIFWPEMHAFLVRICGLNLETSLQIYRIQWMAHRVLWVKPELWGFLWALHYSLRVTEPSWNATHIHPRGVAANPLRLSCRWDAGPQMTPPPFTEESSCDLKGVVLLLSVRQWRTSLPLAFTYYIVRSAQHNECWIILHWVEVIWSNYSYGMNNMKKMMHSIWLIVGWPICGLDCWLDKSRVHQNWGWT